VQRRWLDDIVTAETDTMSIDPRPASLAAAMLSAAIASATDPARFRRGREYYREGAVRSIDLKPGLLTGAVYGSRRQAYEVEIRVPVTNAMTNGGAPAALNVLVPGAAELRCTCTCPDWDDPCKHAVAILLGFVERVKLEPSLLEVWRSTAGAPKGGRGDAEAAVGEGGLTIGDASSTITASHPSRATGASHRGAAGVRTAAQLLDEIIERRRLADVELLDPGIAAFVGVPPTDRAPELELPTLDRLHVKSVFVGRVDIGAVVRDALEAVADIGFLGGLDALLDGGGSEPPPP
jgi:SWIM zinc finger